MKNTIVAVACALVALAAWSATSTGVLRVSVRVEHAAAIRGDKVNTSAPHTLILSPALPASSPTIRPGVMEVVF